MQAQLRIIAGPDEGRVFSLIEGQTLVIGRGQTSQTKLRDPHVSRTHCQIEVDGGKYRLSDNGSAGGTFVDGDRVNECELRPGSIIRIGDTQLRFLLEGTGEHTTLVAEPPSPPKPTPQAAEQLTELVGKSLSHYEVKRVVAKGASGMVFQAGDTKEDRTVALKVLWPEFSRNDEEMQRFVRAMRTVMPIRHPNIVAVFNAGKTGAYCWIAMEYVEGESLTEVIERIGTAGMLDWRNAFRAAVHIARALEVANEHQMIHRNITPQNILIRSKDKLAKLGDLMLAKAMEGTLAEQITRPGELIGDVAYMSPDRTRSGVAVDGRSDIYSLGATVYALLTGRPPFEGGSLPELITKIRQQEPVKPKKIQLTIPDMFEDAVLQMLEKRPEDRYQTATDLVTDLERIAKYQALTI